MRLCAVCLDISLLVCLIPGPAPCSALHTWPTWKTSSSVHQHTAQQLNSADLMHFLSHVFVCFCSQLLLVSATSRKEENLIVWFCFSPRVGSLSSTCCLIHICKGHLVKKRGKDCEKIVWSHHSEQVHVLIYLLTLFSLSFCPALIS